MSMPARAAFSVSHIFLAAALLISAAALPWWATLLIAVLYLSEGGSVLLVVGAGILMDALYGAPFTSLGGFRFAYTLFFGVLALATLYLRDRLFA